MADATPRRAGRRVYAALTLAIVAAAIAATVLALLAKDAKPLPIEFRIVDPKLSRLPVVISDLRSCSCWDGPRSQAERKYKFRVTNTTDRLLTIGGGERSALRLLVAYPRNEAPQLTLPRRSKTDERAWLESPGDRSTRIAHESASVRPSLVDGANDLFAVPAGYRIWAIPPNPNGVAEAKQDGMFTYPTTVGRTTLLPGEAYSDDRLGHGAWTFYVPLPRSFVQRFREITYGTAILPRADYEPYLVFVGIATFEVRGDDSVGLTGFAPAPSDNSFADPGTL